MNPPGSSRRCGFAPIAEWPLSAFDVDERLQLQLALPLLKLAETLPEIGNIHAVWLFNIVVTSLSVGLIYLLLRSLGFTDTVALLVALSAAFSTNLWAYSQTFFREPLVGFFLLLSLYASLYARRAPTADAPDRYRGWTALPLAGGLDQNISAIRCARYRHCSRSRPSRHGLQDWRGSCPRYC